MKSKHLHEVTSTYLFRFFCTDYLKNKYMYKRNLNLDVKYLQNIYMTITNTYSLSR